MIEETVLVTKIDSGIAWIKLQRQSGCGSCGAKGGCGTQLLSGFFAKRQKELPINNTLDVKVGEQVIVGVDENALVRSALSIYLFPLLSAFLSAVFASFVFSGMAEQSRELFSIIFAAAGFVVSIVVVKIYYRKLHVDAHLNPTMLRKVNPGYKVQHAVSETL